MPEPTPSPQPGAPPAAAGSQPGQPPFGSSPATGPTPNRGHEVAAVKMTGMALKAIEQALPLAGASSPLGMDLMSAMKTLAKHVPPGSVTPADVKNALQKLMLQEQQFGQQMQQMKAQAAQPGAQGAGAPPQMPPGQAGAQQAA